MLCATSLYDIVRSYNFTLGLRGAFDPPWAVDTVSACELKHQASKYLHTSTKLELGTLLMGDLSVRWQSWNRGHNNKLVLTVSELGRHRLDIKWRLEKKTKHTPMCEIHLHN